MLGLQGREMHKSLLIPDAMICLLWKAECVEMRLLGLGRGQRKRSKRNLAGALLHSGRDRWKRAEFRIPPGIPGRSEQHQYLAGGLLHLDLVSLLVSLMSNKDELLAGAVGGISNRFHR
ncbi:hypothetical protein Krac_1509 [Ktedonobacter racemifer DSM 44963]|uniref:Uncharacterized protein n=1 Tax=Ktedonobacter racemifer DSM 44963 TaxID=485913 RepID=D6U1Z3_KTERA|nr:hypothetical protein Krac_1509 [Ktedonobacter racemifer DSM 44963]